MRKFTQYFEYFYSISQLFLLTSFLKYHIHGIYHYPIYPHLCINIIKLLWHKMIYNAVSQLQPQKS
jgi:hypothetical protein